MIREFRATIRFLVRELHTVGGASVVGGVTFGECHMLIELGENEGCSINDLCDALVLDKSTVSRLAAQLRKKELIVSERDPSDGRAVRLYLTDAGREKLHRAHIRADHEVEQAAAYLSHAEFVEANDNLLRYAKALRYARLNADWTIRPIEPDDNGAVGAIIRQVMTEFGAVGSGYSIGDPEVDDMHGAYAPDNAAYWVVTDAAGTVVGGAGVGPLPDADPQTCELKKMYFLPEARGRGLAARLLRLCLAGARERGYRHCYLETLDHMHQAQKLYRRMGFSQRSSALGNTGHFKCNTWMVKDLTNPDDETLPLRRTG